MRRMALPLVAAAALLAGCGDTIDAGKTEDLLRGVNTPEGRIVSASCPGGVAVKPGKTFDCKVKTSKGETGTWTVNIENKDGLVAARMDDLAVGPPARPASDRDVGRSFVQKAPGGGRVRVTLVKYEHSVAEPSGNSSFPHVVGIVLRIQNLGATTIKAKRPTYYAVLHLQSTAGADLVPKATGPCGGSFYRSPMSIPPHGSVEGCIPYRVNDAPTDFGFGLEGRNSVWKLM